MSATRLLACLSVVVILSIGFANVASSTPLRSNSDRQYKALTLKQNQYVLGDVVVQVGKNALRLYNEQNDVTILVTQGGKVHEYCVSRKIAFHRTLDDFLKRGSTANWDYDENVLRLPWFQAKSNVYLGRKASLLVCPVNPGTVRRLIQQGKPVDLERHEAAHYWLLPADGYMKEAPAFLSALYKLPTQSGIPLEVQCRFMGGQKPFWQQDRSGRQEEMALQGVRKFLTTKSIKEENVDPSIFEFKDAHYKLAREESEVYLSKETNSMLENMFAPEGGSIRDKKDSTKR